MKYTFKTENTCSKEIEFEIEGNVIKAVRKAYDESKKSA